MAYYFFTHEITKISVKALMNMCNTKTREHPIKSFKHVNHMNVETIYTTDSDREVDVTELSLGFDILFELVEFEDSQKFQKVSYNRKIII